MPYKLCEGGEYAFLQVHLAILSLALFCPNDPRYFFGLDKCLGIGLGGAALGTWFCT